MTMPKLIVTLKRKCLKSLLVKIISERGDNEYFVRNINIIAIPLKSFIPYYLRNQESTSRFSSASKPSE